jgi:hypothetical protein
VTLREGGERRGVSENKSENLSVNHVLIASVGKKNEKRNMIDEEINKGALLQVTRANS